MGYLEYVERGGLSNVTKRITFAVKFAEVPGQPEGVAYSMKCLQERKGEGVLEHGPGLYQLTSKGVVTVGSDLLIHKVVQTTYTKIKLS